MPLYALRNDLMKKALRPRSVVGEYVLKCSSREAEYNRIWGEAA